MVCIKTVKKIKLVSAGNHSHWEQTENVLYNESVTWLLQGRRASHNSECRELLLRGRSLDEKWRVSVSRRLS